MTDAEKIALLRTALGLVLGDIDFTQDACSLMDPIGAVLNPVSLARAHEAMEQTK